MIIDQTPLVDRFVKKYDKKWKEILYLLLIKMLKSIVNYVKYHYQFCENIESSFLSNNLNTNECYIKSCLVYKYLFELYFRKNATLYEVMTLMDITDFLFITNSPVLKNHLIFHHAFKTFWKRHKKDLLFTSLIQQSDHLFLDL